MLRSTQEARISAMDEIKRLNSVILALPDESLNYLDGRRIVSLLTELSNELYAEYITSFPKYIKTSDGHIGCFSHVDFGKYPVYRFGGGYRIADEYELSHGSNNREDLVKEDQK